MFRLSKQNIHSIFALYYDTKATRLLLDKSTSKTVISINMEEPGLTHLIKSNDKPHATLNQSESVWSCSRTNEKNQRSCARESWPIVVIAAHNEMFGPMTQIKAS